MDTLSVSISSYPNSFVVNLSEAQNGRDGKDGIPITDYLHLSGGTVDGDLAINGAISATEYLGLVIPDPDLSQYLSLSGGTINGTVIVFGSVYADSYSGLGSLAYENNDAVGILGGTISNTNLNNCYIDSPYLSNATGNFTTISSADYQGITSSMVGLGNVNNTSDANKPVSTSQQTALNLKLNNSTFAGLSANWQTAYTTVNANSATWQTVSNKLALSGGNLTGTLSSNFNALFVGLTASGKLTASGQGSLSAFGANDVVTRDILNTFPVAGPYVNRYDVFVPTMGATNGGGGSYGPRSTGFEIWSSTTVGSFASITTGGYLTLGALNATYNTFNWGRAIFASSLLSPVVDSGDPTGTRYFCGLGQVYGQSQYATMQYGGVGVLLYPISNTTYNIRLTTGFLQAIHGHNISAATNTSPITATCVSHGFETGNQVEIMRVAGNTAANGIWTITKLGQDTFSLNGTTGNGAYTSNGWVNQVSPVLATGTFGKTVRFVLQAQGGIATLYFNDVNIGSLSGAPSTQDTNTGSGLTIGLDNLSSTGAMRVGIGPIAIQSF